MAAKTEHKKAEKAVRRKSAKPATQKPSMQESLDSPSEKVIAVPIDAHGASVTIATMSNEEEQDSAEGEEKKETEHAEASAEKNQKSEYALIAVLAFFVVFAIAMYFVVSSNNQASDPRIITDYDKNDPLLSNNKPTQYSYNNFEFDFVDGLWQSTVQNPRTKGDVNIQLHHGPRDLLDIPRNPDIADFVRYMFLFQNALNQSGVTYVLYAPDAKGVMGVAFLQVYNNLIQGMSMSAYPAFSNNNTDVTDVPVLSCDDSEAPIIWLRHESPTQIIYREPNCLIVQGEDKELWKAENLLLYIFYGVAPLDQKIVATSPETLRAAQVLEQKIAEQQRAQMQKEEGIGNGSNDTTNDTTNDTSDATSDTFTNGTAPSSVINS